MNTTIAGSGGWFPQASAYPIAYPTYERMISSHTRQPESPAPGKPRFPVETSKQVASQPSTPSYMVPEKRMNWTVVFVVAALCSTVLYVASLWFESQRQGTAKASAEATQAAMKAMDSAAKAELWAKQAKDTMDEMKGELTALSVRMGLRPVKPQGYTPEVKEPKF